MPVAFSRTGKTLVQRQVERGDAVIVRTNVATDDLVNPTIGSGADGSTCFYALIEVDLTGSGSNATWDLTPLILTDNGVEYTRQTGDKITILASEGLKQVYKVMVFDSADISVLCTNSKGDTPTIASIKVIPIQI